MTERRIKPAALAVFTRQLATLVDVGMPLLRGLHLLQEQEENRTLRRVISEVSTTVETGGTLSEALAAHPRVFSRLYVNMVKAGEAGGMLELVLRRQADFLEKALKIKEYLAKGEEVFVSGKLRYHNDKAYIEALKVKHASLEHAIVKENARPHPDDDAICSLKKRKLQIKDEIIRLHERTSH